MELQEIAPRLWWWAAPHPEWRPESAEGGGWGEIVSSYALVADDAFVLFDPLLPRDEADRFKQLDRDVERHGAPAILITVYWHARSSQEIADRYEGTTVWTHEPAAAEVGERVRYTHTFTEGDELPGGVEAIPLHNGHEVAFWLPSHKATVIGDTILGGDGGARLCPASWLDENDSMDEVRAAVHRVLNFPENRLLLTHGGPTDAGELEV